MIIHLPAFNDLVYLPATVEDYGTLRVLRNKKTSQGRRRNTKVRFYKRDCYSDLVSFSEKNEKMHDYFHRSETIGDALVFSSVWTSHFK